MKVLFDICGILCTVCAGFCFIIGAVIQDAPTLTVGLVLSAFAIIFYAASERRSMYKRIKAYNDRRNAKIRL